MARVLTSPGAFRYQLGVRSTTDRGVVRTDTPSRSSYRCQRYGWVDAPNEENGVIVGVGPPTTIGPGLRPATVPPAQATATVQVDDNDFSARATLFVGPFRAVSGLDYAIGGGVNATATNLAAYLDALPHISASALADVVTIIWTNGASVEDVRLDAVYEAALSNFIFTPPFMAVAAGDSPFGPPEFTTGF